MNPPRQREEEEGEENAKLDGWICRGLNIKLNIKRDD